MRFVTIPKQGDAGPAILWEERDGQPVVIAHAPSLEDVDMDGVVEVFSFDVTTSATSGTIANPGNYPLFDADGAPLWVGARISFRKPTHHVNSEVGAGTLVSIDPYGGLYLDSDVPLEVHHGGFIVDTRTRQYLAIADFRHDGPFKGSRICMASLGDPYEHGQTTMFVRLADDPRTVCTPASIPAAAPGGL